MIRNSCLPAVWFRCLRWPSGQGCGAWPMCTSRFRPTRARRRGGRSPRWSAGWSPALTRSMTWPCSDTAGRVGSAPGLTRPQHWARACARGLTPLRGTRSSTWTTPSSRSAVTPSRAPGSATRASAGATPCSPRSRPLDPSRGVTEVPVTAFAAQQKFDQVLGRLVVRRIPDRTATPRRTRQQDRRPCSTCGGSTPSLAPPTPSSSTPSRGQDPRCISRLTRVTGSVSRGSPRNGVSSRGLPSAC